MLRYRFVDPKFVGRIQLGASLVQVTEPGDQEFVIETDLVTPRLQEDFDAFCKIGRIVKAEAVTVRAMLEEKKREDNEIPEFPIAPMMQKKKLKDRAY